MVPSVNRLTTGVPWRQGSARGARTAGERLDRLGHPFVAPSVMIYVPVLEKAVNDGRSAEACV